jgi:hypothetical protein
MCMQSSRAPASQDVCRRHQKEQVPQTSSTIINQTLTSYLVHQLTDSHTQLYHTTIDRHLVFSRTAHKRSVGAEFYKLDTLTDTSECLAPCTHAVLCCVTHEPRQLGELILLLSLQSQFPRKVPRGTD